MAHCDEKMRYYKDFPHLYEAYALVRQELEDARTVIDRRMDLLCQMLVSPQAVEEEAQCERDLQYQLRAVNWRWSAVKKVEAFYNAQQGV